MNTLKKLALTLVTSTALAVPLAIGGFDLSVDPVHAKAGGGGGG